MTYHDRVVVPCMQHQTYKAFGKTDNVCKVLSGAGWTPKWETRVVIAVKPIGHLSYVLQEAKIVMQRWSDNLYMLRQST